MSKEIIGKQALIKRIKNKISEKVGESVDFRKHAYLENQYGLSPVFDYDFAQKSIESVYDFLKDELIKNSSKFRGWDYCLSMEIEELRTSSLKMFIDSKVHEYMALS